jgi:hypothetical protein
MARFDFDLVAAFVHEYLGKPESSEAMQCAAVLLVTHALTLLLNSNSSNSSSSSSSSKGIVDATGGGSGDDAAEAAPWTQRLRSLLPLIGARLAELYARLGEPQSQLTELCVNGLALALALIGSSSSISTDDIEHDGDDHIARHPALVHSASGIVAAFWALSFAQAVNITVIAADAAESKQPPSPSLLLSTQEQYVCAVAASNSPRSHVFAWALTTMAPHLHALCRAMLSSSSSSNSSKTTEQSISAHNVYSLLLCFARDTVQTLEVGVRDACVAAVSESLAVSSSSLPSSCAVLCEQLLLVAFDALAAYDAARSVAALCAKLRRIVAAWHGVYARDSRAVLASVARLIVRANANASVLGITTLLSFDEATPAPATTAAATDASSWDDWDEEEEDVDDNAAALSSAETSDGGNVECVSRVVPLLRPLLAPLLSNATSWQSTIAGAESLQQEHKDTISWALDAML